MPCIGFHNSAFSAGHCARTFRSRPRLSSWFAMKRIVSPSFSLSFTASLRPSLGSSPSKSNSRMANGRLSPGYSFASAARSWVPSGSPSMKSDAFCAKISATTFRTSSAVFPCVGVLHGLMP